MYRNYRDLSDDELRRLGELYPVTTTRELSEQFNLSVDAIARRLAVMYGWHKDKQAVLRGSRGGHRLTEDEVAWIVKHYKHTSNEDILQRFGIGGSSLYRLARKLGLKKSRQHMQRQQRETVAASQEVCLRYGIYDDIRERQRERCRLFKEQGVRLPGTLLPGESVKDRIGERRFRESVKKGQLKRNETIRKERVRIHFGMEQKTKLRLTFSGYDDNHRLRAKHRTMFRKYNYIVERGSNVVYYDDLTDRHPRMEASAHKWGLRVEEAAD